MKVLEGLDRKKLTDWFEAKLDKRQPFFYSSVDIRDSGHKLAPVDTNLFPAGFNNLNNDAVKLAINNARSYFKKYHPEAESIAILTENFSRNKFYWDNISVLQNIIQSAGYQTVLMVDDQTMPELVESNSGLQLKVEQAALDGKKIKAGSIVPDAIIANRDFTSGSPTLFTSIQQPVIPPIDMGWHRRRKSQHFATYDILAKDFAESFSFDPWLISTLHQNCGKIDFKKGEGFECLADNANNLLSEIRQKYYKYAIESDPYLFIKADSGTFGMGIMTIKSIMEIKDMNKKIRNKMDRIKEGVQNTEVIIQEGVPTINQIDGKSAEPFIYCVNGSPVGAILRVNENRDQYGNLNSSGMYFEPVQCQQIAEPCEYSPLGIIARLASLAAIYEAETMQVAA